MATFFARNYYKLDDEQRLKVAYVNKERAAQYEENLLLRQVENDKEQAIADKVQRVNRTRSPGFGVAFAALQRVVFRLHVESLRNHLLAHSHVCETMR